jgi:hypothetical protein
VRSVKPGSRRGRKVPRDTSDGGYAPQIPPFQSKCVN